MDPKTNLARKLIGHSFLLLLAYLGALALWWYLIVPVYSGALALPMRSLVRIAEGPTKIVQEVKADGRDVRVVVKGYQDTKTFPVKEVVHGNLPLFIALAIAGLIGVPWKNRFLFLLFGLFVLYLFHLTDVWLSIRLVVCDPSKIGDIAVAAFSDFEAKLYDKSYNFIQFARRFMPVALFVFGVMRYRVVQRLLGG